MLVRDIIEEKLKKEFTPEHIEVHDESHMHAGHATAPDGGQSHFRVVMVSDSFTDQNRVMRQRMVNKALKEELAGSIHALSLFLKCPAESVY